MWNKDEVEGKGKQIKGAAKEKIGEWTDDESLTEEGTMDRVEGNIQQSAGKARRKAKELADDVKKDIRGK
ncbi:MAG: CsbD family protein [Acidobacteria bacterium]|nr:CsbD family protein [Acidobacteriota bacterium]